MIDKLQFLLALARERLFGRAAQKPEEVAALQARSQVTAVVTPGSMGIGRWQLNATSILAWLVVGIPIAWGVWITLKSAFVLFK